MSVLDHISFNGARYDIQDTKTQAMAASAEASSTADVAHTAGSYFIYGGTLYKATADIAVGDTITPGTNCEAVPDGLGGEIAGLKSILDGMDTAAKADEGKVLTAKAVSGGKVTEWDFTTVGLSSIQKSALLACFEKVTWIDGNGQDYYDALYNALYHDIWSVTSISAVYTQSGPVYHTNSLDSLKNDLVVTATYEDGASGTITDYTLSGTLAAGTSTITVTYGDKTATFSVTVTDATYTFTGSTSGIYGKWVDKDAIIGLPYGASNQPLTLAADYTIAGGVDDLNLGAPIVAVGRATSRTQIIVGIEDGQTVGLSSYTLSSGAAIACTFWYGYIDDTDNTFSSEQYISSNNEFTARTWLSESKTLPTDRSKTGTRFLLISFKKGDGSVSFTSEELAEIPSLIQIQ